MTYFIFNKEGALLDILNFDSEKKLKLFKEKNPTYIVESEQTMMEQDSIYKDIFLIDDDEEDAW